MSKSTTKLYQRHGFGGSLGAPSQPGLIIIDFNNGFADPAVFGGGNIKEAIKATVAVLQEMRRRKWPVAHIRSVYADDQSDALVGIPDHVSRYKV